MTDAIDRLKKRARATVPPREATLTKKINDSMTEVSHSTSESIQKTEGTAHTVTEVEELPEVVRRTIRIEEEIDSELEQLCRSEKITREVFLEAAYQVCGQNPDFLAEVMSIAKSRYQRRKAAGEQRKFKTMQKKYRSELG